MSRLKSARPVSQRALQVTPAPPPQPATPPRHEEWTRGTCPNCGYARADVDGEGVLWCPACGYSKKGCYT